MGRIVFKLPDVGEGVAEAEIVAWRVAAGDTVEEDQPLVDVMTDKATVEMGSPVAGVVSAIHGAEGDIVAVGSVLAEFEVEGAAEAQTPEAGAAEVEPPTPAVAAKPAAKPAPAVAAPTPATVATSTATPLAAPAVRQRAKALGVDLATVSGSGPEGRVTHRDLDALFAGKASPTAAPAGVVRDGVEDVKVIGLRRRIAEKMQESKRRIPHFGYVEEIDVTELETLRTHLNAEHPARPRLSLLPFLARAMVRILPEFPQINALFDDEAGVVHRHAAVHLGVAVNTPDGLMVPVVRHAEALDLWACAAEIGRLAEAARAGKAAREELSGSTITITSLGALGGVATTPIINHPEVAIIGPNRIVERPVVVAGQVVVRKMMNLSSAFDHRVVDGYDGALFVQRIRSLLEHPATLFMG